MSDEVNLALSLILAIAIVGRAKNTRARNFGETRQGERQKDGRRQTIANARICLAAST